MNFRILAKILGILITLIGLAMGVCALYAWIDLEFFAKTGDPDEHSAIRALLIGLAISVGCGGTLAAIGWGGGREIMRREAIVIVGLGWILAAVFGAIPYLFCDPGLSVVHAIFESTSGITTTGSTIMTDIESFPNGILLWRSFTQWLGGIGILVLFVAVLSFLGVGSRSLMQHESSLNISDSGVSRIRDIAAVLVRIYLALTIVCALGLGFLGMPPFEAICHAMTTVATGGFSPKNASIGHYDNIAIEMWISVFMLLGGISFMLYVFIAQRKTKRVKSEEEAKFYLILLLCACLAIGLDLLLVKDDMSYGQAIHETFFNVISISTTTGYAVGDYDQWPLFSRMMLIVLMVIGGCAGSTAGGVKMNRIILFLKIARQELIQLYRPNQVFRTTLNGVAPDKTVFVTTSLFLALSFIIVLFAGLLVALFESELELLSVFGSVFATLFNTGPGFDAVGPTDNFAFLHPYTLILLSLLMVIGRLEIFAILVLFLPSLWRRY
ncbi:MAG: TrkH family potassium uptake protein [Verrucomicrobiales bacterium]|nr:TrkH family potassium uptake protein [Verrucomicrobiales bacterium]